MNELKSKSDPYLTWSNGRRAQIKKRSNEDPNFWLNGHAQRKNKWKTIIYFCQMVVSK